MSGWLRFLQVSHGKMLQSLVERDTVATPSGSRGTNFQSVVDEMTRLYNFDFTTQGVRARYYGIKRGCYKVSPEGLRRRGPLLVPTPVRRSSTLSGSKPW